MSNEHAPQPTNAHPAAAPLPLSEAFFRTVVDSLCDPILIIDADQRLQYVNTAFLTIFGYQHTNVIGQAFATLLPLEEQSSVTSRLLRFPPTSDAQITVEHHLRRHAAGWEVVETTVRPLSSALTAPATLLHVRVITNHKQAETQLQQSEARFRTLYETMLDGVIYHNLQGEIISANPAAERILGMSLDQLRGISLFDPRWHMMNEDGSPVDGQQHPTMQVVTSGMAMHDVVVGIHNLQANATTWININAVPQFLPDQTTPYQVYATFRDITRQRQDARVLQKRLELMDYAVNYSFDAVLQKAVDQLCALVNSPVGFFHEIINDGRNMQLLAWSTQTLQDYCQIKERGFAHALGEVGAWADAAHLGKALIYNDYDRLPHHEGLPTGHSELRRMMVIPIMRNNHVRAIIGVGNKANDYSATDLDLALRFADYIWDIAARKQAEQEANYRQTALEKVILLGKNITAITDLDRCLREIYASVKQHLGFDRVGIFLYESVSNTIHGTYRTSQAGSIEDFHAYVVHAETVAAWHDALHSPTGMSVTPDYQATYHPTADSALYGVKQHVTMLAWAGDTPVAIISVDNLTSQREITAADIEALQLFAGYAGLAIENARLHTGLEQRIKERTAEVQDLYDNAPNGYHSLDTNGVIVMVNQTELNWLGYTREELIGRKAFRDLLTPQTYHVFTDAFPTFKAQGWVNDLEYELIRKDGSILPVVLNATAVFDANGTYIQSRSTMFDITERKRVEMALRQSRDELRLANTELSRALRTKDEFLANMSHELRTPLNAILALSESLLEQLRGPLNERQQNSLRSIEASGRHLLALINDILDLSKVEAGRLDLQIESILIADICHASLSFIKEIATKKSLLLSFHLNDQLAAIDADPKRLKQMLVNLLSNAVKFTPVGGKVRLAVTTDAEAGSVRFVVEDTGIGITPTDMARLFQPFTQLDSGLSRQHEGSGLGLVLVRHLAELHRGSVTVESQVDVGSRFTLALPYRPARTVNRPSAGSPVIVRRAVCMALVIENIVSLAEQLVHYLQEIKVEAIVQPQGVGTLEQVINHQPDIILLDLLLPDCTGWEVLAQLKADPRTQNVPVIIISVVDEWRKGLAAGAAAYLVKPVSRELLRQAVNTISAALVAEKAAAPIIPPQPIPTGLRVLLAEDNEANILAIGGYLEDKGYTLAIAHNGREALDMIRDEQPHLILMDIQMPEMDGLEATRRLRAQPEYATIPIIALTALAMPGDRERCLAAGANEYLTKPVSLKGLVESIQRLLKKYVQTDGEA